MLDLERRLKTYESKLKMINVHRQFDLDVNSLILHGAGFRITSLLLPISCVIDFDYSDIGSITHGANNVHRTKGYFPFFVVRLSWLLQITQ